jgi:hypothetical protein
VDSGALHERALAIYESRLGAYHPSIAKSRGGVGQLQGIPWPDLHVVRAGPLQRHARPRPARWYRPNGTEP